MTSSATIRLPDLDAGMLPCPLCNGAEFTALAHHDRNLLGITTVGCRACGFVQTNPRPSPSGLDRFYRDHYRMFYQGASEPNQAYIENLNKDVRLAYTAAFFSEQLRLREGAVVLDFGCGEGSLFAALRKAGFTGAFYGVELNAAFGEYASRYGNALVSNTISAREPVDLVIVNHVLEHLADPMGTLNQLGKLLTADGRIYIDVPDVEGYTNIQDLHIAHIYHFSTRTLSRLVIGAGFDIERVEQHRPPHHPPSIRLVGRFRGAANQSFARTTVAEEAQAWAAVKKAGRFGGTIRLRLGRNRALKRAYSAVRQWLGH